MNYPHGSCLGTRLGVALLVTALAGAGCAPTTPSPGPGSTMAPTGAAAPTRPPTATTLSAGATRFSPDAVTLGAGESATITVIRDGGSSGAIAVQFNIVHDPGLTTLGDPACVGPFAGADAAQGTVRTGALFACTTGLTGSTSGTSGPVLTFTVTSRNGAGDTLSFHPENSFYLIGGTTTEGLGTTNRVAVNGGGPP
jgi:hypothetical protein